ncbi:amino acid ABC transporter substrate-binding protein [Acuticoccus mangrovi]|uniref:Amino acid ABC transporter substrate-binding protein n=1 Tax=Acuticoccus mangrovi TaxID=2796142 RepID=A0A934MDP9_9HYPH|nr:amino acid ABC transporter substrate-binding protein [Acuticoccus mangrovi]MBJ3776607.1 amino acid ABC transporter substrate-binding protein [Acuticoccus mangrovi]
MSNRHLPKPRSQRALATATTGLVALSLAVGSAAAQDTVKIGAPLALTGGLADEGKKQALVYDMWEKKVNDAGGIEIGGKMYPVEIIEYDYQTDGPRAGQLAERLITEDEVNVLMAPFGSGHTKIAATVGQRYRIPTLACVASSESVYSQGNPYLFGTLSPNANMTAAMVEYLKENVDGLSKVAVYGRDDVFPKSMAAATAAAAEAGGLEVVYNELYPVGTMDHAAAISSIVAAEPDWVYATGYTQDLILIRRQLADLGVKAPVITMVTGPAYVEFTEGLGELANGVTSQTWWHHSVAYEGEGAWKTTKAFYDDFLAASGGEDPDYVHGSCAGALVVLEDALKRAGSLDGEAIRQALADTDITTFYGPINFGENGMNQARELPIIQVQDEAIEVLYPASIATAELELLSE